MALIRKIAARITAHAIAGFARLVTGVYGDWRGCPPAPMQRVYFANHTSHGDFVLIWTVLPFALRRVTRPVAAADYWSGASLKGFVGNDVFKAVLVERGQNPRKAMEAMNAALTNGDSLILFPEGTRNTSDQPLLPLRAGIHQLTCAFPGVEFVPVWIDNIARVIPKGEWLPIPLLCTVIFGEPLEHLPDESRADFIARATAALLALKPETPRA